MLVVVGDGHAVEFCLAIVSCEYAAGVFPGDGASGFYLCPGEFAVCASEVSAFGDEVEYSAFSFAVAGVPVLYGAVFDFCAFVYDDFDDGCVELVFVAHGCGASFEVGDVCVVVADDECAFELSCAACVDAEVCAEFHGAAHAFGM